MVAKSCPRDEVDCIDRIKTACQRLGLAEKSKYVFPRGGQSVTGPSIDLMTVIANCWGNIDYGFRELSQANGESHLESYAWDLETNAKRTIAFTVQHKRYSNEHGLKPLIDPRDVYENNANNAQRRMRKCLEDIIPTDIVAGALDQCALTINTKWKVTPESIASMLANFEPLGITREHVEKRLRRRLESMEPGQLHDLRQVWKSITDKMSEPGDWFEMELTAKPEQPKTAADATKEALRAKSPVTPPVTTTTTIPPQTAADPSTTVTKPAETVKPETYSAPPCGSHKEQFSRPKQRITLEALRGYCATKWEQSGGMFNLDLLVKDASESVEPYGFIDSVMLKSRLSWEIYSAAPDDADEPETLIRDGSSLKGDETSQVDPNEDPINAGVPEYVTDGAPLPGDFCEVAVKMRATIIGKRNAEIIRQYATEEVSKHPDLNGDEIAYLTDLANRRAWQLENNVPTTDRLQK